MKPEIFYRPIGNSGPLAIYLHEGPFGDAIECKQGNGVAWMSTTGKLMGVEFDDVDKISDHQILIAPNGYNVEVWIKNQRVKVETYTMDTKDKNK